MRLARRHPVLLAEVRCGPHLVTGGVAGVHAEILPSRESVILFGEIARIDVRPVRLQFPLRQFASVGHRRVRIAIHMYAVVIVHAPGGVDRVLRQDVAGVVILDPEHVIGEARRARTLERPHRVHVAAGSAVAGAPRQPHSPRAQVRELRGDAGMPRFLPPRGDDAPPPPARRPAVVAVEGRHVRLDVGAEFLGTASDVEDHRSHVGVVREFVVGQGA